MIERSSGTSEDEPITDVLHQRQRTGVARYLRSWRALSLTGCGIAIGAIAVWLGLTKPWVQDPNPFTPAIAASVQFPLYYPTTMPKGFHIDKKSVSSPEAGVIVFNLVGPRGGKIYISEEARPATFDLGGFYKSLKDMKEIGVSEGAIAVGHTSSALIASRANNKTWILSNTRADVPQDQLVEMLKSITHGF